MINYNKYLVKHVTGIKYRNISSSNTGESNNKSKKTVGPALKFARDRLPLVSKCSASKEIAGQKADSQHNIQQGSTLCYHYYESVAFRTLTMNCVWASSQVTTSMQSRAS